MPVPSKKVCIEACLCCADTNADNKKSRQLVNSLHPINKIRKIPPVHNNGISRFYS